MTYVTTHTITFSQNNRMDCVSSLYMVLAGTTFSPKIIRLFVATLRNIS